MEDKQVFVGFSTGLFEHITPENLELYLKPTKNLQDQSQDSFLRILLSISRPSSFQPKLILTVLQLLPALEPRFALL